MKIIDLTEDSDIGQELIDLSSDLEEAICIKTHLFISASQASGPQKRSHETAFRETFADLPFGEYIPVNPDYEISGHEPDPIQPRLVCDDPDDSKVLESKLSGDGFTSDDEIYRPDSIRPILICDP